MKKFIFILPAVFIFFILAAVIAPFVVDLNKFKPVIKKVVEQNINGTFDIENIELTILSGFGANLSGLNILSSQEFEGSNFFQSKSIRLKTSIFSIFTGVSKVDLMVDSPEVTLVKNQKGKLNLIDLIENLIIQEDTHVVKEKGEKFVEKIDTEKVTKDISGQKDSPEKMAPEVSLLEVKLMELLKRVVVNVEIKNSKISYYDLQSNTTKNVHDFNLSLNDVRLGEKFDYTFSNILLLQEHGVEGPLSGRGEVFINFGQAGPDFLTEGEVTLDKLKVKIPKMVEKKDSDKSFLKYHLSLKDLKLRITKNFSVRISNLMDRSFNDEINFRFRLNSNLNSEYIPQFTDFSFNFDSKGSDLGLRAKVTGVDNFDFVINSKYFKIDDFITPPPPLVNTFMKRTEKSKKVSSESNVIDKEPGKASFDLQAITDNPYFLGLKVNSDIRFDRIIAARTDITNFIGSFNLNKLKVFSSCTFNIFKGNINVGQFVFNIRAPQPLFDIDATLLGIDLGSISNEIIGIKDAMQGKVKGSLDFSGSGIDTEIIKKTIKGKARIDGTKIKIEVFNVLETLKKEVENIPIISNFNFANYNFKEGYDIFDLDLTVANEKINIGRLDFIKHRQHVLALKGTSTLEFDLELKGDVILLPPFSQTVVNNKAARSIFLNRKNEAVLPFFLNGGMEGGFKYGIDMDRFESLYLNKVKDVAVDKAKDKIKEVLKDSNIGGKAIDKVPDKHKDKAKKIFKKFGL